MKWRKNDGLAFLFEFLKDFFLMWTIFKVFIEFFTIFLLFYACFLSFFFLSSLTKDWTLNLCIGRWNLNHWTARKSQLPGFNDRLPGIIVSACVFSSSFLRIVSRTSNMPFILMLSLWYVKYFWYHHITAWEAGRSERQKSRNVFHLTKCLCLLLDFTHFSLTWSKFALLQGTGLVFICIAIFCLL